MGPQQHHQRGRRERLGFGSSTGTYLQIYCGVFYTEYRVTSTAYADSYLLICRAIRARVRILVSRVDPFAHHHLNRVLRPTGQLSVIEVDIRNRYYYSTTQNRNTGNLHRPPGGQVARSVPRQERFTRDDGNYR